MDEKNNNHEKLKKELDECKREGELFRNLYMSSSDAIMTIEPPDWRFASGNPAAIKMFGAKDERAFTSLGPWDVAPEIQPDGQKSGDKSKKMIEKAFVEGSNFFEWTHKKIGGEEFPTTVLLSKVKTGDKDILQATVRNISDQKETEKKLKEKMDDLEKTNKIMTGRELKMIELKKEIEDLKNKLSSKK